MVHAVVAKPKTILINRHSEIETEFHDMKADKKSELANTKGSVSEPEHKLSACTNDTKKVEFLTGKTTRQTGCEMFFEDLEAMLCHQNVLILSMSEDGTKARLVCTLHSSEIALLYILCKVLGLSLYIFL